jgi:hypothetical protein
METTPNSSAEKQEERDPWTGGFDWERIFNLRVLILIIFLFYLAYLFMKYFLPLAKKSFGK